MTTYCYNNQAIIAELRCEGRTAVAVGHGEIRGEPILYYAPRSNRSDDPSTRST